MSAIDATYPNKAISNSTIFEYITQNNHERITYFYDQYTGLKAIIAIHSTVLGPALGGTRIWNYAQEAHALVDALRLSRAMTYKTSIAGLDLGGGKAVIIGNASKIKTEAFLRQYGRFVDQLHGSYIAAPDVNTTTADMEYIAKETQHVTCCSTAQGGSGDSARLTAFGTYLGIKAATKKAYGHDSLQGKKIGIEGVGKVGCQLISHLCKEGTEVYITDISEARLATVTKQYRVKVVQPNAFYDLAFDIYAPCALGGTLNDQTIQKLQCQVIAGAANNQLEDEVRHGRALFEKGIVYAPDFVINAGGVINASAELAGAYNPTLAQQRAERIYETCLAVLTKSAKAHIPAQEVAKSMAEQRIQAIRSAHLA